MKGLMNDYFIGGGEPFHNRIFSVTQTPLFCPFFMPNIRSASRGTKRGRSCKKEGRKKHWVWQVSSADIFYDPHFNAIPIVRRRPLHLLLLLLWISVPLVFFVCLHSDYDSAKSLRLHERKQNKSHFKYERERQINRSAILTWDYGNWLHICAIAKFHSDRIVRNKTQSIECEIVTERGLRPADEIHRMNV